MENVLTNIQYLLIKMQNQSINQILADNNIVLTYYACSTNENKSLNTAYMTIKPYIFKLNIIYIEIIQLQHFLDIATKV